MLSVVVNVLTVSMVKQFQSFTKIMDIMYIHLMELLRFFIECMKVCSPTN